MFISDLRTASKFVDRLIECGYVFYADLDTLLRNMGIATPATDVHTLLTAKIEQIFVTTLRKIGIEYALYICDELCAESTVRRIMNNVPQLDALSRNQIINAKINEYDEFISAYNNGYRACEPDIPIDPNYYESPTSVKNNINTGEITNACANGLYLWRVVSYDYPTAVGFLNKFGIAELPNNIYREIRTIALYNNCNNMMRRVLGVLQLCPNTDTLYWCVTSDETTYLHYDNRYVFTKNIKNLTTNWMSDTWLSLFTNLRKLDVSNNTRITSCELFAKTIVILIANGRKCVLGDIGLKSCTKIKLLSATENVHITTCDPFAATLKTLYADVIYTPAFPTTGMSNKGLSKCKKLRFLSASGNYRITTCAPFATSLKILHAARNSGLSDTALQICVKLKKVYSKGNNKITERYNT